MTQEATAPFDSVVFKYYASSLDEMAGFKNGEGELDSRTTAANWTLVLLL